MRLISNYPKVLYCLSKSASKDPCLSKDLKKLDSSSTSFNANGFINSSIFSVGTKPNLLLLLINFFFFNISIFLRTVSVGIPIRFAKAKIVNFFYYKIYQDFLIL